MARKPSKPKKTKQDFLNLTTARPFRSTTTYQHATNSLGIPFPRVRTVTINDQLSFWTPHLKEYVLQCLRQGMTGRAAIQEWMNYGDGSKPPKYVDPQLKPNPFQAMQTIPGYRKEYRDAIQECTLYLEEQLVTGSIIDKELRTYESYGQTMYDPASVRVAQLKTNTAIRCLQSLVRTTWSQQQQLEKIVDEQQRFQIYIPKKEAHV